jgi:hypothetical protein
MRPIPMVLLGVLVLASDVANVLLSLLRFEPSPASTISLILALMASVATIPVGALAAGIAIDRGHGVAALIAGPLALAAAIPIALASGGGGWPAIASAAVAGAGTGAIWASAFVTLALLTSPTRRPWAVGILLLVATAAALVGPVYSGGLPVLIVVVAVGLTAAVSLSRLVPAAAWPERRASDVRWVATAALLTLGVATLVIATGMTGLVAFLTIFGSGSEPPDLGALRALVLGVGLVLLVVAARRPGVPANLLGCLALVSVVGAAATTAVTTASAGTFTVSDVVALSSFRTLAEAAGMVVGAWWLSRSPSPSRPATLAAALVGIAAAGLVLTMLIPQPLFFLVAGTVVAAALGTALIWVTGISLLADVAIGNLGRTLAAATVAVLAGSRVGSMLATSLPFAGELASTTVLLDATIVALATVGGLLLAWRLSPRPSFAARAGG